MSFCIQDPDELQAVHKTNGDDNDKKLWKTKRTMVELCSATVLR